MFACGARASSPGPRDSILHTHTLISRLSLSHLTSSPQAYETELQDDSEFQRWKGKMLEKDEADRREEIEHRRDVMEAEAAQAKALREVLQRCKSRESNR
jgi:hypothetical protein